jgi:hypothetical protein
MNAGDTVYDVSTKYTGTLLTGLYLPDNGSFRLVADVRWDSGDVNTVYTDHLRRYVNRERP